MGQSVDFIVGNEYRRLPHSMAKLDRTGCFRKVHDWTLYVDVLEGDPDLIERVVFDLGPSFSPESFICAFPVPVKRPNGAKAWRFATRQQTYGSVTAHIKIRGTGGNVLHTEHEIVLGNSSNTKSDVQAFYEPRPTPSSERIFKPLKLDDAQCFGIELELTSPPHISLDAIAARIPVRGGVHVIDNYHHGRITSTEWKMVPDSSIVCSASVPDCHKFELVSPVLQGGAGLSQVSLVLRTLGEIQPKLQVNKSMGFHVHIDISALSLAQLIRVCQNFIKYEDVLDRFQPPSRRTGSAESSQYFQSNRQSVTNDSGASNNKQRHNALASCIDKADLVSAMNRDGRYYKLNLQNLVSGRQPTIEFRQHSATMNYEKVSSWVRFCVAFVTNSAKFKAPTSFASQRPLEDQFHALFQFVIKDRALRNFYWNRFEHWSNHAGNFEDDENEPCCSACASGSVCSVKNRFYQVGLVDFS